MEIQDSSSSFTMGLYDLWQIPEGPQFPYQYNREVIKANNPFSELQGCPRVL